MEEWRRTFQEMHSINDIDSSKRDEVIRLLASFKNGNPKLLELNPEVAVAHIGHDENMNPINELVIVIGHEFIFDYKLIPKEFEGQRVTTSLQGNLPKEFFPDSHWLTTIKNLQPDFHFSYDKYTAYINSNIKTIRRKLKSESLTEIEALEVLTEGTKQEFIDEIKRMKEERMTEHKDHISFFNQLLAETKDAYSVSKVKKHKNNLNWGYSIASTSLKKNSTVIVGFNWGEDKSLRDKGGHGPQKEYPEQNFYSLYNELGSFKRVFPYIEKYPEVFEYFPKVQTSYCFFRSEKESQIKPEDLALCSPLFDKLISYLEPNMLISFSKRLNNHFKTKEKLQAQDKIINSGVRAITATKGKVKIKREDDTEVMIPYFNLPHPNYPITRDARGKAWEFCFGDLK